MLGDFYREFLSELSRNSPACGLLQLGDNTEAVDSLRAVIQQSVNVQDTSSHRKLSALQTHAPIIAKFVCRCPKTPEGKLPGDVCSVMEHVLETVQRTYLHPLEVHDIVLLKVYVWVYKVGNVNVIYTGVSCIRSVYFKLKIYRHFCMELLLG